VKEDKSGPTQAELLEARQLETDVAHLKSLRTQYQSRKEQFPTNLAWELGDKETRARAIRSKTPCRPVIEH
jgi:hypothetical protein